MGPTLVAIFEHIEYDLTVLDVFAAPISCVARSERLARKFRQSARPICGLSVALTTLPLLFLELSPGRLPLSYTPISLPVGGTTPVPSSTSNSTRRVCLPPPSLNFETGGTDGHLGLGIEYVNTVLHYFLVLLEIYLWMNQTGKWSRLRDPKTD